MDAIAPDSRLHYAIGFLNRDARMLVDGKMVPPATGKTFPVCNPATGAGADHGKFPPYLRRPEQRTGVSPVDAALVPPDPPNLVRRQ